MRAKLTKEEMAERIKFYEENGEAAFITKYNRYRGVIYVYRKKLGLGDIDNTKRKYKLPKLYSCSKFTNFTKEDKIKFIEYYKTHTGEETAKRYKVSGYKYVSRLAQIFHLDAYDKPLCKKNNCRVIKLTKEEMMKRIKFYEENGRDALKNKYNISVSSIYSYRRNLRLYKCDRHSDEKKREMIEYYKTHTGKETAIKYGYKSAVGASSAANRFASYLGYSKPLKFSTHKHVFDKDEILKRIKFYEENGTEEYANKYGVSVLSVQSLIFQYCKQLRHM